MKIYRHEGDVYTKLKLWTHHVLREVIP